jgi:hypothetical protein
MRSRFKAVKCGGEGSGKPGPCPESGSDKPATDDGGKKPHALDRDKLPATVIAAHSQAAEKAEGILKKAANLPRKVVAYGVGKAKALYAKMEAKYGPRWAKAIVAVGVITFPTPFTTGAVMATIGMAMLSKKLLGSGAKGKEGIDLEKVFAIAEDFTRRLVEALDGVELSDEDRASVEALLEGGDKAKVV